MTPAPQPARFFAPIWMTSVLLAAAFLIWSTHGRIKRVEYVSSLAGRAEPVDQFDATSPTGYAQGQRELIIPEHYNSSYHWILQTQQMLAEKESRVRTVSYDNAPFGRAVNATSPYRWWLGLTAWIEHTISGRPLGWSVEQATFWADPLLQLLFLVGTTLFIVRQFGSWPAGWFALATVTVFPFAAGFMPGAPDDHGLTQIFAVWSVLLLLAGFRADSHRQPRVWFLAAGVVGGLGLWTNVAGLTPLLIGLALGAVGAAFAARFSGAGTTGAREQIGAGVWRIWGLSGATTVLFACIVEYFPDHLATWQLQAIHPLYGLAWLGGGELLALITGWLQREKLPGKIRNGVIAVLAVASVAALPVVMAKTHNAGFFATDPTSFQLTKLPGGPREINLHAWLTHHGAAGQIAATLLPVLLLLPALWFSLRKNISFAQRRALILVLGPALVALGFGCWQLSWWGFFDATSLLLVTVMTAIGCDTPALPSMRWLGAGLLTLILGMGITQLVPPIGTATSNHLDESELLGLVQRDLAHWLAKHAVSRDSIVLAPPKETTALIYYGGLRGLGTLAPENQDGLGVAIRIASASTPEEAKQLIDRRGVAYIVIPSWDSYLDEYARIGMGQLEGTFLGRLHDWKLTPWLRPVAYQVPTIAGFEGQSVTIFSVVEDQDDPVALSRIAEYFVEMGQLDPAASVALALRRFPADLGAWIARAQVETARADETGLANSLKVILPKIKSGAERALPWDRRVALAAVLAQAKQMDLAREQVRRCVSEMDEAKLRALPTGSLYRLEVLAKAFGLGIPDQRLHDLALDLLPVEIRGRF